MPITILRTKLNLPPDNLNLVRRQRLMDAMDDGLHRGHLVTLVCAPTGYGKTTLVSQWIHDHREREPIPAPAAMQFIWLSLDQEDNDLARFIAYMVAALQQIRLEFGQGVLAALQNTRSASTNLLATLLINDLTALANPVILVLEDYHAISTQSIHEFISYLIDHQPPHLHLLIIARGDPPLPFARLRAKDQLTEIRLQELALTDEESEFFLKKLMQLDLSSEQVKRLQERTEGWAAGLQLAVLSMRHTPDMSSFIQSFSGGHEYIADYLTSEVLEQLDQSTRDFLLQTSILKQFSAPLCEAVSRQQQCAQIIEKLASANAFLIPLDNQREWYRYHALFADLLRKRLLQSKKDILDGLHNRAGEWYDQNKMLEQAIEHYLAGENYARAATLIEENAEQILMAGQTVTYLRWMATFPIDQLFAYPVLVVYQGVAMMLLGKIPENALSMLGEITSSTGKYRGEMDSLNALYSVLKGHAPEAIYLSESALQDLPVERAFLRLLAADSLAMGYTLRGDLIKASLAFERVVEASKIAGNVIMMLIGMTNLAGLHYQQGHLNRAWDEYQNVLDLSREKLGNCSQPMARALFGMGELAREWNDLDAASKYLTEATEIFRQLKDIGLPLANVSLARVYLSMGEREKVQVVLEDARQHSRESKTTTLDDYLTELMQARLWLSSGELERVEQWVGVRGLTDRPMEDLVALADHNATAFELIQGEFLILVRFYIAKNETQKALDILDVLLIHNENNSQIRRVIEILVLQAIAYQQQGANDDAMQAFTRAINLAQPENYIRTFLDEGKPVVQLLRQAIAANCSLEYVGTLLTAFTGHGYQSPRPREKAGGGQGLIEPLSDRELEVLGLVAQGMTNQEISHRLHITLSTVKGHTSNIYGKLGVVNRTQAIKLAQDIGLLGRN